jgi:hypothetical protein
LRALGRLAVPEALEVVQRAALRTQILGRQGADDALVVADEDVRFVNADRVAADLAMRFGADAQSIYVRIFWHRSSMMPIRG